METHIKIPNQAQGNAQGDNQGQNPPLHNPFLPNAPLAPEAFQSPQLNWSHFKPEFICRKTRRRCRSPFT